MGNNSSAPAPDTRTREERILDANNIPRAMQPYFANRKTYAAHMLDDMNLTYKNVLIENIGDLMNKYNSGGFDKNNKLAGVGKPRRAYKGSKKRK
jgi:hypothetical protein